MQTRKWCATHNSIKFDEKKTKRMNEENSKVSDNGASVMMEYCAFYANDQPL